MTRGDMAIFVMRGGFNQLLPPGTPMLSVSPAHAILPAGASGTFTVTGVNTHFSPQTTVATAGGVTASDIHVLSATQFTVTLTASPGAPPQPEPIYVLTGAEEAVLPNAIAVQ